MAENSSRARQVGIKEIFSEQERVSTGSPGQESKLRASEMLA